MLENALRIWDSSFENCLEHSIACSEDITRLLVSEVAQARCPKVTPAELLLQIPGFATNSAAEMCVIYEKLPNRNWTKPAHVQFVRIRVESEL